MPLRGLGAREIVVHGAAIAAALRGAPLRPFLAASAAGDVADIARHRGRPPRAARRRRPGDARRRRRIRAADRGPRGSRRALSLAFDRAGTGPVLVLLHPLGADRHVWEPVMDRLTQERDVIAFDLPGFGDSPPLNGGPHTPAALAAAVADALAARRPPRRRQLARRLGRARARGGRPRELGDRDRPRRACGPSRWRRSAASRARSRAPSAPIVPALVRSPAGRRLALASTVAHAERVPPAAALRLVRAYADAPGFEDVNRAMRAGRFTRLEHLRVPVTLAWPEYDRLVAQARAPAADRPQRGRSPTPATSRCGTRPSRSRSCCCRAAGASSAAWHGCGGGRPSPARYSWI